ncbi:DNA topoisomerase 2 [Aspergillus tanneri]|uniref:DNA topoisomerase 2 n=1 Tax=Aspergillus tanneri TaxID=1220188 RepID=A0A5M9N524_9EURO|nr:DNA topoisomerase 2 [Aspergillus tanneri]KAA8649677.1 DNA topoisomerase 2 [Aspergillus tanneri]
MDDDSMMDSILDDEGSSDFVPEPAPKPKAKAAPKKAAAPKRATQTTLTGKSVGKAAASKKRAKPESDDDLSEDNILSDNDSMLSHTPPKKPKKAPATKKGGSKPLADVENESFTMDGADEPTKDTNASEKYQKAAYTT